VPGVALVHNIVPGAALLGMVPEAALEVVLVAIAPEVALVASAPEVAPEAALGASAPEAAPEVALVASALEAVVVLLLEVVPVVAPGLGAQAPLNCVLEVVRAPHYSLRPSRLSGSICEARSRLVLVVVHPCFQTQSGRPS